MYHLDPWVDCLFGADDLGRQPAADGIAAENAEIDVEDFMVLISFVQPCCDVRKLELPLQSV